MLASRKLSKQQAAGLRRDVLGAGTRSKCLASVAGAVVVLRSQVSARGSRSAPSAAALRAESLLRRSRWNELGVRAGAFIKVFHLSVQAHLTSARGR